jgi:hypothetical protein
MQEVSPVAVLRLTQGHGHRYGGGRFRHTLQTQSSLVRQSIRLGEVERLLRPDEIVERVLAAAKAWDDVVKVRRLSRWGTCRGRIGPPCVHWRTCTAGFNTFECLRLPPRLRASQEWSTCFVSPLSTLVSAQPFISGFWLFGFALPSTQPMGRSETKANLGRRLPG